MFDAYQALVTGILERRCPTIAIARVRPIFEGMLRMPMNVVPASLEYSQIEYFVGVTFAFDNKPMEAVAAYERSLEAQPGATYAMVMASQLATNSHFEEALYLSEVAVSQIDAEGEITAGGTSVTIEDIRRFQQTVRSNQPRAADN